MTIITDEKLILILKNQANRYIEICLLFDSLVFPFENTMREMDDKKLNNC